MGKNNCKFSNCFLKCCICWWAKKNLAIIASPQLTQPKGHESLNYIFPTKYGIPKSLKVSHWLSESNTHPISLGKSASSIWNSLSLGGLRWTKNTATAEKSVASFQNDRQKKTGVFFSRAPIDKWPEIIKNWVSLRLFHFTYMEFLSFH